MPIRSGLPVGAGAVVWDGPEAEPDAAVVVGDPLLLPHAPTTMARIATQAEVSTCRFVIFSPRDRCRSSAVASRPQYRSAEPRSQPGAW